MTETVTDIIVARSRQSEGLQAMVLWSAAGHVLFMRIRKKASSVIPRKVGMIRLRRVKMKRSIIARSKNAGC